MASVRKEIVVAARPDYVWKAVRDVGALSRIAKGVVRESRMEGDIRVLTYDTGIVLREWVVDIDDAARRLVVCATGGRIAHFQSAVQVYAAGENFSRIEWICDFLPDLMTPAVRDIIDRATAAAKGVLERGEY